MTVSITKQKKMRDEYIFNIRIQAKLCHYFTAPDVPWMFAGCHIERDLASRNSETVHATDQIHDSTINLVK